MYYKKTRTPLPRLSPRHRYACTASRNNIQTPIYSRKYTGRLSKKSHFACKNRNVSENSNGYCVAPRSRMSIGFEEVKCVCVFQ